SKVTARVAKNLDVESVTKKFYTEFTVQRKAFQEFLREIIPIESDQSWYVSVMLNRLMFIYFIQAKRFLNGDPDYLRTKLRESQERGPDRYYGEFLRTLFFEGFACEKGQRPDEVKRLLGNIPYLNGGLFLKHPLEEQYGERLDFPDKAFTRLFDFFSE